MIFSDIEDTSYVAFYTVIRDVIKNSYIHKHIYTMIPMLIDAKDIDEAKEKAKINCNRELILDEVREIRKKDRDNILKFYGCKNIAE